MIVASDYQPYIQSFHTSLLNILHNMQHPQAHLK
jgi:hypothetical protein